MSQRSGAITERIELYKNQSIRDEYGGSTDNWVLVSSPRCRVRRKKGREQIVNSEVVDVYTIDIDLRNQWDIKEQDRVKYNGTMFVIDFINPSYYNRWVTLRCSTLSE